MCIGSETEISNNAQEVLAGHLSKKQKEMLWLLFKRHPSLIYKKPNRLNLTISPVLCALCKHESAAPGIPPTYKSCKHEHLMTCESGSGSGCEMYYTWECRSLSPPLDLSVCARSGRDLSVFSLSTVPNLHTAATWGPRSTDVGWNNYEKNRDLDGRYNIQGRKLVQHCGALKTQKTYNSALWQ